MQINQMTHDDLLKICPFCLQMVPVLAQC